MTDGFTWDDIFDAAGKVVFWTEIEHNGQESAMYELDGLNVASGVFIGRISRMGGVLGYLKFLR